MPVDHEENDLVWNPYAGWGVVTSPSSGNSVEAYLHLRGAVVSLSSKGFYVNLKAAVKDYPVISESLNFIFGVNPAG